jgi:hypothetical protein
MNTDGGWWLVAGGWWDSDERRAKLAAIVVHQSPATSHQSPPLPFARARHTFAAVASRP